jgi:hypothetical protein
VRSVWFDQLPTVGFIEFRGMRVGIVHPEHRYRQRGRDLIRDCFQLLPEDLEEGPQLERDLPDPGH